MTLKIHGANGQVRIIRGVTRRGTAATVTASVHRSMEPSESARQLKEALDRSEAGFRAYHRTWGKA